MRHVAKEVALALVGRVGVLLGLAGKLCRRLALGARKEVAEFCHFTTLDGWSGLRRSPLVSDERGRPEYISVEVSTLDSELAGLRPSVVKIDVEGAELAVLEGGRGLLASVRPVVILEHVVEASALYGVAPAAPWELLTELGYELFSATGDGPFEQLGVHSGAFPRAPTASESRMSEGWMSPPSSLGS